MKYCEHIAHTISFNEKDILTCCTPSGYNPPTYYNSRIESHSIVHSLDIDKRQKEIMDIINSENITKYSCANCIFCKEVEQLPDDENKINLIFLRQWKRDENFEDGNLSLPLNYDAYELIKKLYETNKIDSENLVIKLQCDDLSTATDVDKYIELFNQKGGYAIHVSFTEKVSFNENLAKLLPLKKASINLSLDAGTKDLYKKIKKSENFDSNIEILKKYSTFIEENKYALCIHYSLYKGINDNKKDINAFLKLMKELNIACIGIRINNENLTDIIQNNDERLTHYKNLVTYFYEEAKKSDFYIDNNSCVEQNFILEKKSQNSLLQGFLGFFK